MLKCIKIIFFIFLKLFLRSAHQNDLKHTKKKNLAKKKFNFFDFKAYFVLLLIKGG
jgi:hypothetical protein